MLYVITNEVIARHTFFLLYPGDKHMWCHSPPHSTALSGVVRQSFLSKLIESSNAFCFKIVNGYSIRSPITSTSMNKKIDKTPFPTQLVTKVIKIF